MKKWNCKACGKIHEEGTPFTVCSTCKKRFCEALTSCCFSRHVKQCKGAFHITIINPNYKINLRSTDVYKKRGII